MNEQKAVDFILAKLESEQSYRRVHAARYRHLAKTLKMAIVVCAASTTLLVAATNLSDSKTVRFATLTISAMATVLTTWEAIANHHRFWVLHMDTVHRLEDLHTKILFERTLSEPSEKQVRDYYDSLQQILDAASIEWKRLRRDEKSKKTA